MLVDQIVSIPTFVYDQVMVHNFSQPTLRFVSVKMWANMLKQEGEQTVYFTISNFINAST